MKIEERITKYLNEETIPYKKEWDLYNLLDYIEKNLSKFPEIRKYCNKAFLYHNDIFIQDMPLSVFKKYGITQNDLENIRSNTKFDGKWPTREYIDIVNNLVTISGN